jgi:hypothetical protein
MSIFLAIARAMTILLGVYTRLEPVSSSNPVKEELRIGEQIRLPHARFICPIPGDSTTPRPDFRTERLVQLVSQ